MNFDISTQAQKGALARAANLTPRKRATIARRAARARWTAKQTGPTYLRAKELADWKTRKLQEQADTIRLAAESQPWSLYLGDILTAPIADASADLIMADPPYPKEFLDTY